MRLAAAGSDTTFGNFGEKSIRGLLELTKQKKRELSRGSRYQLLSGFDFAWATNRRLTFAAALAQVLPESRQIISKFNILSHLS